MKILWMSRHQPLPRQITELERLFGRVEVEQEAQPFDSAETIAERYHKGGFDDLVVVAPLSVIARLVDLGLRPLWGETVQVHNPAEAEITMRRKSGRIDYYRFDRFRRVKALRLEFEELQ